MPNQRPQPNPRTQAKATLKKVSSDVSKIGGADKVRKLTEDYKKKIGAK